MDGVIKVNIVNFITVGLMALIFVFLARLALTKFAPNFSAMIHGTTAGATTSGADGQ